MSAEDIAFPAKKPVSVWNRPLDVEYKGLFAAVGRAAWHGATGQWMEAGADAVDGLSALGIERDAPQLAWLLIRRALLAAMLELVGEGGRPEADELEKVQVKELGKQLDESLGATEVAIDSSLFERPGRLPFLEELQPAFSQWLEACGLDCAAADSTAGRLPSYFVAALHAEWRRNAASYEPIRQAVDTPFTRAAERERAWAAYAARLSRQVDEPMFSEAFSLRQVYVPLRAFYVKPQQGEAASERFMTAPGSGSRGRQQAVVFELEKAIDEWVRQGDRRDCYRVISGGPGSGKSSFARMYAARLAGEGSFRVLFIPLHQFNVSASLAEGIAEFVRATDILPGDPLDPASGEGRLLIVFDGLDELAQQGRVAAEVARDFVREIQKTLELRNGSERRLLALITGREPVVQAAASELRDPRQVLHVLPYLVRKLERGQFEWEIHSGSVEEDQRGAWWRLYAAAKGKPYGGIPEEFSRPDLEEITAQPLLNYLVALSYDRGRLDFTRELNLNEIYKELLEAVYQRMYEQGRAHEAIRGMEFKDFTRVLEEIALAAWHGNGRTTTVAEIKAHCQTAGLSGLLEQFANGAEAGVARVLTAFYFRRFGRDAAGDDTFEFTHKSFREYLTALRILRALERIATRIETRRQTYDDGWDERQALHHWAEIFGPNPMDMELLTFVRNEVRCRGKEDAGRWQRILCHLIGVMLRNGMPMERMSPRPSYQVEVRQARNAEEALLAVLNACARETETLSKIEWPTASDRLGEEPVGGGSDRTAAGNWISHLRGQRIGPVGGLALECLSFLDLSGCVLDVCDLAGANLRQASLEKARMQWVDLGRANLIGAHLTDAILFNSNLIEADLTGANLTGARLSRASLTSAHLTGANLAGANLTGVDLREAKLSEARFDEESLRSARLSERQRAVLHGPEST